MALSDHFFHVMKNRISGCFSEVRKRVGLKLKIRSKVKNLFWLRDVIFQFWVFS